MIDDELVAHVEHVAREFRERLRLVPLRSSSELLVDQIARERERDAAAPARSLTPGEVRQRDETFIADLEPPGGPA